MPKQRAVVSVHIDIADIVWATREIKTDSEWAKWGRTFVEALATRNPQLNPYAGRIMQEVLDFRKSEADRIQKLRKGRKNETPLDP